MTTRTSPSRRVPSRASSTAKKRPKSGATAKKAPPKTPVRQILSPWARDALGIGLVVLSLLAVLSVWFDAAGPVGGWLSWTLRGAFGVAAVAFPVVGAYWGILLLRDTVREERVRMFIGFSALGLGMLGILSLLGSDPSPGDGYQELRVAGGLLGSLASHPLGSVVSGIGAAIVCLGFVFLGGLIFTGPPVAAAWSRLRDSQRIGDDRRARQGG